MIVTIIAFVVGLIAGGVTMTLITNNNHAKVAKVLDEMEVIAEKAAEKALSAFKK